MVHLALQEPENLWWVLFIDRVEIHWEALGRGLAHDSFIKLLDVYSSTINYFWEGFLKFISTTNCKSHYFYAWQIPNHKLNLACSLFLVYSLVLKLFVLHDVFLTHFIFQTKNSHVHFKVTLISSFFSFFQFTLLWDWLFQVLHLSSIT